MLLLYSLSFHRVGLILAASLTAVYARCLSFLERDCAMGLLPGQHQQPCRERGGRGWGLDPAAQAQVLQICAANTWDEVGLGGWVPVLPRTGLYCCCQNQAVNRVIKLRSNKCKRILFPPMGSLSSEFSLFLPFQAFKSNIQAQMRSLRM